MPIYEYKCNTCGRISEFLVSGKEPAGSAQCPSCGGRRMERVLSAPGGITIQDKGGHAGDPGGACCGMTNPCESPKKCCTKK
ncbi:MAG: zinc ribbon domain-containing protein [Pseudomonadota bacterium]